MNRNFIFTAHESGMVKVLVASVCVCVCVSVCLRDLWQQAVSPWRGGVGGGGLFFPVFHLCRPTFNERTGTAVCLGYLQNSHE